MSAGNSHLKILYLVPDLLGPPGGIARYCRYVCRALHETGEEVDVVCLRDSRTGNVDTAAIPAHSYIACGGNRLSFIRTAFAVASNRKPDLIICGHPNFSPLARSVAASQRVPWCVFLYGTDAWEKLRGLRGASLRKADLFIAISAHTARISAEMNQLPPEKIRIVHNCLDPDVSFADADHRARAKALLTVSRITKFEPLKGHELVLETLPRLLERHPDLVYDVVGDGSRRASLEQMAKARGVAHAVRFHGVVSDDELTRLYGTRSIFVMPSRVEGFGFVFAEAMAHGMPAIGGSTDASGEVIVDGVTGFVVDPDSTAELHDRIIRLIDDEALRETMANAAIQHARTSFSFATFRDRLSDIVTSLCRPKK